MRYRLPLFPLPVVLFPGASMPLHIFEPRYRTMVTDVLEGDGRFGLVYHDPDDAGPFLSEEGAVGCLAEITEHQALEDGRSLIVVLGVERFSISDGLESDTPYYEGLVTPYLDQPVDSEEDIALRREESIALFRTLVASLADPPELLPDLAAEREVSFVLAQTIQVEAGWLQGLLDLQDEGARLTRLNRLFRKALG